MKGQGGGGTARGGGKSRSGGGTVTIKKSKARQTKDLEGNVLILREALFEPGGKDKNVTASISPAFMKYDRNDLDLKITFSTRLLPEELDWAFNIVKDNMEDVYDASGYGWDDDDKMRELTEDGTRFLLVRDSSSKLIAFCHFRFTVQGEVMDIMCGEPSVFVWDLHVEEDYQRKGVGKHLLMVLELIARQQKMRVISVPVQFNHDEANNWMRSMRGYAPDESLRDLVGFDAEMEGFEVFSKVLVPIQQRLPTPQQTAPTATQPQPPQPPLSDEASARAEESSASEDTEEILEITLNEAIDKLKQLFVEKNGRDPTSDELAAWEAALSEEDQSAIGASEPISQHTTTAVSNGLSVSDVDCSDDGDYVVVDHATLPAV